MNARIAWCAAEKIIGKVVSGIEAIENKQALSHLKPILNLMADLEIGVNHAAGTSGLRREFIES